jgi:histidine triad (HIT) family protein
VFFQRLQGQIGREISTPQGVGILESVEDDLATVLLDHAPVFFGHALVIPNAHIDNLLVATPDLAAVLMRRTQETAKASMHAFSADGVLTVLNTIVSQSVPHLHIHVIPRHRGDGLRGFLWPRKHYDSESEIEHHRDRLRAALGR